MKHQPLAIVLTTLAATAILLPTPYKPPADTAVITNPWGKPIRASQSLSQPSFTQYDQLATVAVKIVTEPSTASSSRSGDYYLDWIITHESGWNPHAMNPIGACGLGQSLPCSKVLSKCGTLDNVACQIEWVREYCVAAYGSTYNAWLHWQSHHWY